MESGKWKLDFGIELVKYKLLIMNYEVFYGGKSNGKICVEGKDF